MLDDTLDGFLDVEEGTTPYNIRHRAFYLAKNVLLFIQNSKYEKIHFSIFDQLVRSVSSIGANMTEGIAGSSKKILLISMLSHSSLPMKQSIGFA
ncbi:MAG: hypothetical protein DI598_13045 [Pseudopedobacter saltans]|uniref:Four helix bundle protein n=1 Tax=Pseudopedobacter saltans TaxID=151895 RepID=A0A2W5ESX2_9SPHI|nr:MAG: hypothetical protein DI598_13045 [Pseudopedobacter saltans]